MRSSVYLEDAGLGGIVPGFYLPHQGVGARTVFGFFPVSCSMADNAGPEKLDSWDNWATTLGGVI